MQPWCPRTPISFDTPGIKKSGVAGTAHHSWSHAGGTFSWKHWIELRTGLEGDSLRHVAIHECAHIVQYRLYALGLDAYGDYVTTQKKVFGANAMERLADCMAALKTGRPKHMTYLKSCTPAQNKAAADLWARLGTKYQSPTYSTTSYPG